MDHFGQMHKRVKDSHTTMYILEHIIYISENPNKSKLMQIFVHGYGTCSRASALGNKNTQTHPRIAHK